MIEPATTTQAGRLARSSLSVDEPTRPMRGNEEAGIARYGGVVFRSLGAAWVNLR